MAARGSCRSCDRLGAASAYALANAARDRKSDMGPPNAERAGLTRSWSGRLFLSLLIILAQAAQGSAGELIPQTPCSPDRQATFPAYGEAGSPPAVATWHHLALGVEETCSEAIRGPMAFAVALAGRFRDPGSLSELAARIGAISSTKGLLYWSTTDGTWRELIANAFALRAPSKDARRPDFDADEILSGHPLYFAQADTRSTGLNLYSLTARRLGPDRLVVEVVNLTPIRFLLFTLFEPKTLLSVQFFERLPSGDWGYYSLSAVRHGPTAGHQASFVN